MGNEFKGLSAHSAEYFGDTRDYWWNTDFLAMLAARWQAPEIETMLDVGCGVGHWGRALLRVLPGDVRVEGIDREPLWIENASDRAVLAGISERARYQVGVAEALPFADASFDLVTCQTLLIHVREPAVVLREMMRVVRPGGLVLVAEPTNVADVLLESIALDEDPAVAASLLHFQLVCQRGKKRLGLGSDLLGESLPALFAAAGLRDVETRLNDRAWAMVPPYASAPERAQKDEAFDCLERGVAMWDQATTLRYFLAGGGVESAFPAAWDALIAHRKRVVDGLGAGTYACAGGGTFYLTWGRRPHP